ncbi:MAG: RNA methyltransferase [Deltaproteobacteria bacterium]|nr:RNA methyltransferase [Deltaproteobacteria bacterium]
MTGSSGHLYVALVHYPVYNKTGRVIASAVSNLDLHDISRAAKTFGVHAFYVVTPLNDQQALVKRIVSHWIHGVGAAYNPDRKAALELIRLSASFEDALCDIAENDGASPVTVVTDAHPGPDTVGCEAVAGILRAGKSVLLTFGTAWGLTHGFIEQADMVLDPIVGLTSYNHLSVRSAVAIMLDRVRALQRSLGFRV